ncbi:hypothetical protein Agub_g15113, partial [Astrephomene gubernaculifera]
MPGLSRCVPFTSHSAGQSAYGWKLVRSPHSQALPARHGCCATASLSTITQTTSHLKSRSRNSQLGCLAALPVSSVSCHRTTQSFGSVLKSQKSLGTVSSNTTLTFTATTRTAGRSFLSYKPPSAVPEFIASLASSPYRDYYVVGAAAVGALAWVKLFDFLAGNGTLEQKLSRKVVHTTAGPIFVLTWALFSAAPAAKYLAALVPMLNMARLLAVGTGLLADPGLVKSVSRSGDRGELLKGPLYYVVTLVGATLLCWRDNPAGLIAVSMMCGGDGLADIVGRRWGAAPGGRLPYNPAKSWAGSAAMLVGGYGMSYGLITLFCHLGFFSCYPPASLLSTLGLIAAAATLVESLPIDRWVDDNMSVPGVAAVLSMVLLSGMQQPVAEAVGAVGAVG